MIDKFKKLNKKQKIIYISLISILLICLVLLCSIPISKVIQNNKIKNLIQQGKLKEISYKVSKVYENGLNADVVVTIASEQEIDCVIYKNSNNEDVVIYANNRNVVAIDYKMVDKNSYSFDANYKDGTSKTLTIDFEIPRIKGNYTLNNGIYVNEPEISIGFSKEKTRYMYLNENNNLVPGNWINGQKPENWYNYKEQNWANIYSESDGIDSYYVWIPRYCYKIDTTNSVAGNERMDVKFINTYNEYIDGETNQKTSWEELKKQGYQIPEAFWWDNNGNGIEEEGEQLSGYWITKYQLSEASNHNRIDANLLAGSRLIRVKEITGSLINEAKSNNINMKFEYYLDGELMQDAIGEAENENYVFKNLNENTTYTINIILRNKDTNEFIGAVTKKIKTITPCEPNVEKFNKDVTYYVWYDNEGNEQRTPLTENPPSNWYDYSNNMWANIVTTNGGTETYFVWIPRYEYKLDGTVYPQKSIINFIGTNITKANNNISPGYQIPEAFWWDNNGNGTEEEGEQLSGYWITKYQLNG